MTTHSTRLNWILLAILVMAVVLRFWQLGSFPIALTPDEAALGYNAYSLLETGKDEYGVSFPVIFKSFGDYKPGLYVYFVIPFVALLGLNEFAVRLPSALAGLIAVWLVYELAKVYLAVYIKKGKKASKAIRLLPYVVAFILAVNPWHIHFSRSAWEANVALTMLIAAMILFIKAVEFKRFRLLIWAAILCSLTFWMYQGAKMTTPLAGIALLSVYGKQIFRLFGWKRIVALSGLMIIIALPVILTFFTGRAGRLAVFSILSYRRPLVEVQQTVLDPAGLSTSDATFLIFHGEWLSMGTQLLRRYFHYFSGRFLFFEGDWMHPQMWSPYMGMFYPIEVLFLVLGLAYALKHPYRVYTALLVWLLLAPLPATFSRDEVNSVRSLPMVFPLVWFVGLGLVNLSTRISTYSRATKFIAVGGLACIYVWQVAYLLNIYFVVRPMIPVRNPFYGYKQIVEATQRPMRDGKTVVVNQSYAQPYIYFLFYSHYDPALYQQTAFLTENLSGDVGLVEKVNDQLQFQPINWSAARQTPGTVFVGDSLTTISPSDSDDSALFNTTIISYPNGEEAFRVVDVL